MLSKENELNGINDTLKRLGQEGLKSSGLASQIIGAVGLVLVHLSSVLELLFEIRELLIKILETEKEINNNVNSAST